MLLKILAVWCVCLAAYVVPSRALKHRPARVSSSEHEQKSEVPYLVNKKLSLIFLANLKSHFLVHLCYQQGFESALI
jgi:hypothetical protein